MMADETQTTNDDHAKALVDALLPAVTKAVQEQVAKRIEAMDKEVSERLDGIASKNAQLLGKLHKEKGERVSLEDQLATLNKHLNGDNKPTEIVIDKQTARDAPPEPSPFFEEPEDTEAQAEFIIGSPVRALNVPNGFHRHYFFDLDETRADTLRKLTEGRRDVQVRVGDCNPLIQQLSPGLKAWDIRGVAFLDPYGAHLEWATLEALAATETMEVVINFPVAMPSITSSRWQGCVARFGVPQAKPSIAMSSAAFTSPTTFA